MPTYSEIGRAVYERGENLNTLRKSYMRRLVERTGRALIVYASNAQSACRSNMVNDSDMRALMDVLRGVKEENLDLMVHSDGGSPYAADTIVNYLREKFKHIRVIVPQQAMSAATMMACAANELVLARHSFLGPIDLQLSFGDDNVAAAQEVLDQYALIRKEITDANKFWEGAGKFYLPTLLVQCQNALQFGREVAEQHLREVMFAGSKDAAEQAKRIASDLADHTKHKMHGRRLSRRYLKSLGLKVVDLEAEDEFQDCVLSVHHCVLHTLEAVPTLSKIVLNHRGTVVPTFSPQGIATLRGKGWDIDPIKLKIAFLQDDDDAEDEDEDEDVEDEDEVAEGDSGDASSS